MSIKSELTKLVGEVKGWFGIHGPQIQTGIEAAQMALQVASEAATVAGAPVAFTTELGKVSGGLSMVDTAITAEANASTLSAAASGLTALATGLVQSGDIHVEDQGVIAAVGDVAAKVNGVAAVLTNAAASAKSTS